MSKNDDNLSLGDKGDHRPKRVGILLVPGFAMMSYACVVEALRAANTLSRKSLYRWRHISIRGDDVAASNGVRIQADTGLARAAGFDVIFVCAGGNPQAFKHSPTFAFLRKAARQGIKLGGVSAGPYLLASAGLLSGYRFTIHWEHIPALLETFPFLQPRQSLFEIDRDRLTCAGGIAALDMMHAFIRTDHGSAIAAAVSDWFLQTDVRRGEVAQRLSPTERFGVHNAKLVETLLRMEERIEVPFAPTQLAKLAGVSVRQLERLFAGHLRTTIKRRYLDLRLEHARKLLRQTALPVSEIALASGFSILANFSRSYAQHFGISPRAERDVENRAGSIVSKPIASNRKAKSRQRTRHRL
jgi:transcriptional regulator GlxA family with amidase domain